MGWASLNKVSGYGNSDLVFTYSANYGIARHVGIVLAKDGISDMELCFRALYGVMLYRMKGDTERSEALAEVVGMISPVIALLADAYGKAERGEISLFQE